MGPTLGGVVVGFVMLTVVFWPMERLRPAVPGQPRWRRDSPTDLAYWFFTPLVTRGITRAALFLGIVLLAMAGGVPVDRAHLEQFASQSRGVLSHQPVGFQIVEILLLGDLLGYGTHRLFHRSRLWPFHAIHHSSTQVDWLSSVRLHPVNDVLSRLLQALPLFLLGFQPGILAAYLPFLTFYAILLHANVPWTFGPMRYVVASPAFHRWHHTKETEGLDKNFAGLLPAIDLLFGTFYMPAGRQPQAFGIESDDVPDGLLAQLAYPFRRSRPASPAA